MPFLEYSGPPFLGYCDLELRLEQYHKHVLGERHCYVRTTFGRLERSKER
jgi:hypothetical protein